MNVVENSAKYDAVIVLANQMDVDGNLNDESKARAVLGAKVFDQCFAKCLVTCGWDYRDDTEIKIANAFKEYITRELGGDGDRIICEPNSRDTVGDAYFTKVNLAIVLRWKNICVVTSDYHVARTQEIFNFIYGSDYVITVIGAPVDADMSVLNNELASSKAFRETFLGVDSGDDGRILDALRTRHPFYNGRIYEKI